MTRLKQARPRPSRAMFNGRLTALRRGVDLSHLYRRGTPEAPEKSRHLAACEDVAAATRRPAKSSRPALIPSFEAVGGCESVGAAMSRTSKARRRRLRLAMARACLAGARAHHTC